MSLRSQLYTAGLLALLGIFACGDSAERAESEPPPQRESAPAAQTPQADPPEDAPATERMLGKWRLNLAKVPETALTKEFRELKKTGDPEDVRIEYTVTDREFIVETWGAAGRVKKRWFYEVIKQHGDALVLERTDEHGEKQQIPASVEDGILRIGTGNGIVPLERIES